VLADGGPGSIWKIDGQTGAVTLFTNVTFNGLPNSGRLRWRSIERHASSLPPIAAPA
jgi:hypothetical protein